VSLLLNSTSDLYLLANLVDLVVVLPFSCHSGCHLLVYDNLSCYVSCGIASHKLILGFHYMDVMRVNCDCTR
jgi:hypothetical protein